MVLDEQVWTFFQKHLGYNDEEMKRFRENPRNEEVLSKVPALMKKTIVAEVKESHGCNSQHEVGDKFYFDGSGNLITKLNPKRICLYALSTVAPLVFTAIELFFAGSDPNEMRFKRTGCFDVGVQCGGWGRVVLEIRVEDFKK
jgi:uncharacterized repeat protein (TIGR04076 family)